MCDCTFISHMSDILSQHAPTIIRMRYWYRIVCSYCSDYIKPDIDSNLLNQTVHMSIEKQWTERFGEDISDHL